MRLIRTILFLTLVLPLAHAKDIPTAPLEDKSVIQAIVIRQQTALLKMKQLELDYKAAESELRAINQEGQDAQLKLFKKLKLDPDKYVLDVPGDVVIREAPKK